MVLFKRKPVQFLPRPTIEDDSSEVWVIPETNEVFVSYEAYLQRMNFYKQKRFICEITGHSGLTFFEALRSETENSKEVDNSFPEALKEHVLRRIQFSTISRIDSLVDQVYDDFKQDFYPGERVTVLLTNGSRIQGIVSEKAGFPEVRGPDGRIERRASSRYLVKLINRHNEEALVDDEHLTRDRKVFTKQMLRSFIKNTVSRESWNGAPWLVKPHIAELYHIDTEVPKHLQYGNKAGKKANIAADKEEDEALFGFFASNQRQANLKAANKGQKVKYSANELEKAREAQYLAYQRSLSGNPSFLLPGNGRQKTQQKSKSIPGSGTLAFAGVAAPVVKESPPPPPVKYPIEDLDIKPERDGSRRPGLKFLSHERPEYEGVRMESVGLLLETWNTLNVYCEVFQLDSFTFDDYVEALHYYSEDRDCELVVEIHCAVLKTLVNAEDDQDGAIQISLPALPEDDSEEEEEQEEEEQEEEPEPEPRPRRTTRSSAMKFEVVIPKAPTPEPATPEVKHRAAEMFGDDGWIDRLRKRDFKNGGWELVLVGLLHRLSYRPRLEKTCNEILSHLAPLDMEPTQETARKQYAKLDINLRIQALQIICMLTLETKAIKNYMEECSNQMTEFRKEKIEAQRARKAALEELRRLQEERKQLEPEVQPSSVPELEEPADVKMTGSEDDSGGNAETEGEEEEPSISRSLRGGIDRELERKRRQEEDRERKEQAARQPKGSRQYQRILKKIQDEKAKIEKYEAEIASLDNDLREADCPRTRVLGKDRFWNRYYWFERNAMPYEGLPTSSTASAGYANGRLWVQGPDDMEREGFIDPAEEQNKQYLKDFGMTVLERKKIDEGPTGVMSAREWGYYDDPESLDKLIEWLDPRGVREMKLRKELQLQRDVIAKYMKNRTEYLSSSAERPESEEPPRMSTRTTKAASADDQKCRCLKWRNLTALRENGHLHVENARPAKRAKKASTVVEEPREIKVTNRQGKPLTRQGTRYNF
ncbi:hypothetical protein VTO42DRAFT_3082 [Malbranchea cinnamomea]